MEIDEKKFDTYMRISRAINIALLIILFFIIVYGLLKIGIT